MSTERHARIQEAFVRIRELPPEGRADALDRIPPSLRADVASLLEHDLGGDEPGLGISVSAFLPPHTTPAGQPEYIGAYRIQDTLGEGGMGTVYLGHHEDLDRLAAIKVMKPSAIADHTARQRFDREARAAARLKHPNICEVFEVGERDGAPFIAMEYVGGETLASLIARAKAASGRPRCAASVTTPFPTTRVEACSLAKLFEKLALALHAAHCVGLVHRDVKPENIVISDDGEPLILDFGIAVDRSTATLTRTGQRLGTPAYMSPEQIRRSGSELDGRSDVYSLGVALFESITLRRPFDAPSEHELLDRILRHQLPDARKWNPNVPRDLWAILQYSLQEKASHRYLTAKEFADDLRRFHRFEPVRARTVGTLTRAGRWIRRNPLPSAFIAVLVTATSTITWLFLDARSANARERIRSRQLRSIARNVLFDIDDTVKDLAGATRVRKALVQSSIEYLQSLEREQENDLDIQREIALGYERVAEVQDQLGQMESRLASYRRSLEIKQSIARTDPTALKPADIGVSQVQIAQCLLRLGHRKEAFTSCEAGLERLQASGLTDQDVFAQGHIVMGDIYQANGKCKAALDHYRSGLRVMENLAGKGRNQLQYLAICHERMAATLVALGHRKTGLESYGRSLAIRRKLADADPDNKRTQRELAVGFSQVGGCQLDLGRCETALLNFQASLAIRKQLAEADPADALAQQDLAAGYTGVGSALEHLNRTDEAAASIGRGLRIWERRVAASPSDNEVLRALAQATQMLGRSYATGGRWREAAASYQRGVEIHQRMLVASTDIPVSDAARGAASCFKSLGDAQIRLGRSKDALNNYSKALTTMLQASRAGSDDTADQALLGSCYASVGEAQLQLHRPEEAVRSCESSVRVLRPLLQADPTNSITSGHLASAYETMGHAQARLNHLDRAIASLERGLAIRQDMVPLDHGGLSTRRNLAKSLSMLGNVHVQVRQPKQAIEYYDRALAIEIKLVEQDPTNLNSLHNLAVEYMKIGAIQLQTGDTVHGIKSYEKSIQVRESATEAHPKSPIAQRLLAVGYSKLAYIQFARKQALSLDTYGKAIAVFEKLVDGDPSNPTCNRNLAIACIMKGDSHLAFGNASADWIAARDLYDRARTVFGRIRDPQILSASDRREMEALPGKLARCAEALIAR